MSSPVSTGMGWLSSGGYMYTISVYNQPTRSTQSCIPLALLNQVPGKGGNVTTVGWQVTLCDPIWHVSSHRIEDSCNSVYFAVVSPEDVHSLGSLVPAHRVVPDKGPSNSWESVCVCFAVVSPEDVDSLGCRWIWRSVDTQVAVVIFVDVDGIVLTNAVLHYLTTNSQPLLHLSWHITESTRVADISAGSALHTSTHSDFVIRSLRLKVGERAFSVVALCVWNQAPTQLT